MRILVYIIIFFLSFSLGAEEIIVCKLNDLSNSTSHSWWEEGGETQENTRVSKYQYYIINDDNKKITHFKTLDINRGAGIFSYDENLENILPFYRNQLYKKSLNILYFTKKEIIFTEITLNEIAESNKKAKIFNKENKDNGVIQLDIDVQYFFELDRVLGLLVVTGLEVDIDNNSYKLNKNGLIQNLFRKTYPCYGKNFIQITK